MLLLVAASSAFAQNYQPPNSVIGVGTGTPSVLSLRGEAWFAEEASFELGVGLGSDLALDGLGMDLALRWRPDIVCINCGGRVLGTFGVGVGSLMDPNGFDGPWGFAVGPDLIGTGVYWFSTGIGLQLSLRGGFGPSWVGTDFDAIDTTGWFFASVGLAF